MRAVIIKSIKPEIRETNGKKFYGYGFGSERHGKISFWLWFHNNFVNEEGKILFPIFGQLHQTEKGNLVVRPPKEEDPNPCYIFPIYFKCGYRGDSNFEIKEPELAISLRFKIFHSPLGNLGVSSGGLILTPTFPVKIQATFSGRLYGDPSEVIYLIKNENLEIVELVDDPENLEDLL